MSKIHLLVFALLGVLLVNLESYNAHSIQDSLPALVLDDENTSSSSSSSPSASPSESSVIKKTSTSDEDNHDKDKNKEKDSNESNVIPYKTDKREEGQQTPTIEQPKESNVESTKKTTSQAPSVADSTTTSKPAVEEEPASKAPEKDINVLLANKDDAENDLSSPPNSGSNSNSAPSELDGSQKPSVVVASSGEKKQIELDSPVETNKQNDDRLHYSFSNSESSKPSIEKKEAPKEENVGSEVAPEKPVEEKKSEETEKKVVDERREEVKPDLAYSPGNRDQKEEEEKNEKEKEKENEGASSSDKELDGKKGISDETSKQPGISAPKTELESDTKAQSSTTNEQTTTTTISSTTAEPNSTEAPSPTTITKVDTEVKKDESVVVSKSDKPEEDGVSKKIPVEADTTVATTVAASSSSPSPAMKATTTTTTTTTDVSTTKAVKPASVPSILAVALGTALGAAVNPIIGNRADKKPPLVINSSASTTTTKAPSSTTKNSSTDRWDRWSTTPPSTLSTSTIGPTRRRPILPSIRRRFRPNRFPMPFPWGGADAYSPVGGDPDFLSTDLPPKPSLSGATNKPSRKNTGSSGEPSLAGKPTQNPSTSSEDDEDEEEVPVRAGGPKRRRNGNGPRRPHDHHHHHNHGHNDRGTIPESYDHHGHHHHHNRHNHHNHGNHDRGSDPDRPMTRRKTLNRHQDRDERPKVDRPSAFDSSYPSPPSQYRPSSSGFGLFNTSPQVGSGFDLLNPFSGWFDDVSSSNRPQNPPSRAPPPLTPTSVSYGRPGGDARPAVEGEYDDHEYDGRYDHHHHNHHQHRRPQNGRDEYEHDYDCDHHRNPYRPNRPHRDREPHRPPIGGYDDNYTPPGGYGRRPARPYNRRDQAEHERNNNREHESSEAAPSLYGVGTPVAARRVPSVFSPFDSLFGSIDDGLFSLRSSFIDSPLRAVGSDSLHTFDTIVSSPKISKQVVEQVSPSPSPSSSASNNKESSGASNSSSDKVKEVKPSFSSLDSAGNNTNDPFTRRAVRAFG